MFQCLNHLIHLRWNQDIYVNSLDFSLSDRQLKISYFSTSSILAYCNYFMELAIKIYDGFKIHLILKVKTVNTSSLVKHKSCHTFWKLKRNTIPSVSHLLCFLFLSLMIKLVSNEDSMTYQMKIIYRTAVGITYTNYHSAVLIILQWVLSAQMQGKWTLTTEAQKDYFMYERQSW